VTSRQHAARQRTVWRALLATGGQDENPKTRRLAFVVLSLAITGRTKVFQIGHHTEQFPLGCRQRK
jgi:hypothetical protein